MKLSIYKLARTGDRDRVLVLVTDEQGRTWRSTLVVGEYVDVVDHTMAGPVAPTYMGGPLKREPIAQAQNRTDPDAPLRCGNLS